MYNGFFGFKERPFKLVPNPDFLFLGKSHEEALAHLAYATSQGDGFVEITGEVGTGKTTLCRVFLEDLDENIEAAFIFNSKLDSVQLIKTIHTELGIDLEDQTDLTRTLNNFLLEKKALGKSVILLIDEAQNLAPETLEQLRLLSNLETTRNKLLQIILVGQPELGDILDSHEMRQLRQRINLSCHIMPLTPEETRDYIDHRVSVASHKPQRLFTRNAKDKIYAYSRGIPRLINIICDRSLLTAYSLNQKKIGPAIVKVAARELSVRKSNPVKPVSFFWKTAFFFAALVLAGSILLMVMKLTAPEWRPFFFPTPLLKETVKKEGSDLALKTVSPFTSQPLQAPSKGALKDPASGPPPDGSDELDELTPPPSKEPEVSPVSNTTPVIEKTKIIKLLTAPSDTGTRENVFAHVLSLWNGQALIHPESLARHIESDPSFFGITARQNNLQIIRVKNDLDLVEKLNLPVVITITLPGHQKKTYLCIVGITRDHEYIISRGNTGETFQVDPDDLRTYLTGDGYIAWRNIFGSIGLISRASSRTSVVSLKLILRQVGFTTIDLTPDYDAQVLEAVKQIQAKHGLKPDGLVGPYTKIVLFNEKNLPGTPFLSQPGSQNRVEVD